MGIISPLLPPEAFKELICDRIGCDRGCNILHVPSLDNPFAFFHPDFTLEKINISDGEIPFAQRRSFFNALNPETELTERLLSPNILQS